jgi:DNA-dependent RNA polymerase auxiliary subunit epsilon
MVNTCQLLCLYFLYLCNLKPAEGTHHKFQWRTAHFDHGPPSGVRFHCNVMYVHVARSSERLRNYIKEANSFSIEFIVHGTLQCRRKLGMHLHITEIMAAVHFT